MTTRNLTLYKNRRYENLFDAVYTGTAAIERGTGLCFDLDVADTGTGELVTDPWGRRGMMEVQIPGASNNMAFAGVSTQNIPADPDGKVRIVQLAGPGGCAMIKAIEPTVVNETQLTCIAPNGTQATAGYTDHAGLFGKAGLPGRGTALALQTQADAADNPREYNYLGAGAYATAGTLTLADAFTNAAVGDIVWILSGDVANAAKAGKYYITAWATGAVTLSATPGGDAATTIASNGAKLAFATQPGGEPLTLAYLYDGEESGLVEWDVPVSGGTANAMVGGTTHLMGGVTLAADDVPVIADATRIGMKKKFWLGGAITTKSYIPTPTSKGIAPDGTIVAALSLQASLGMGTMVWTGQKWDIVTVNTAAEAT